MSARPIVHIEIPTADREAAARFYKELFDWDYEHSGEPMPYTTFRAGNTAGGLTEPREGFQPGNVLLYVESDDIEADLKKAESLGATTAVQKMEIPTVGWMGVFIDLTGNSIALFKPTMESKSKPNK